MCRQNVFWLRSEDNDQHFLLYKLSVPGVCLGVKKTRVLYRLAALEYPCAKATLASIIL